MSISVILIDDERPALKILEIKLKEFSEIDIIGSFISPMEALEEIAVKKPNVVFLDINMPQMMGIDVASRILDLSPETDIIFATAYDQYAIEAFELHAVDYLLKPVSEERLAKTVARLLRKQPARRDADLRLQIRCLGSFQVKLDGREPIKWRAEKTKELFAFLLQNRLHTITKDDILEALWPEDDPEKAIKQLYNGAYYIRKALGEYGIDRQLLTLDSSYNIKLNGVDIDIEKINLLKGSIKTDNYEKIEELADLLTGEYLEKEDYPWAAAVREEYSVLHQNCLIKLAKTLMERGEFEKAENRLLQAYGIDPFNEAVTELLLILYLSTKEKNKGMKHFKTYVNMLKEELRVKPGNRLIELYHALKLG